MCRHADATSTPAVFAVSLLFGGVGGALIAASFGLDGGAGFLAGATLAFLLLWASVLRPKEAVESEQVPLLGEPGGDGRPRTPTSAESAPY